MSRTMARKETKSPQTKSKTGSVKPTLPFWDVKIEGGETYRYNSYIPAKTFAKNYIKSFPSAKLEISKVLRS